MWRLRAAPRAGPCPRVQLLRPRQPEGPASAAAQHHGGAQADLSIVRTSRPRSPDCVTVHIAGRGVDPRDVTLERLTDLNDYVTGLRRRAAGADLAAKDRNRYRAPRRRLPAPTNAQVNGSTLTATSERDSDFCLSPTLPVGRQLFDQGRHQRRLPGQAADGDVFVAGVRAAADAPPTALLSTDSPCRPRRCAAET